ncbi:MAG: leucine-rich repeat domain-containing protein [Bacteroidales bacterium]|nr:leucine-rich repeat domain-containing protein [Bacteroidales bacterium]
MRLERLTAGTLAQQLPDTSNVKELALSGEINGADVTLLRSMCGCEGSKDCLHAPVLERLDLSGVRIVPGGFAEDARAVTERDEIGGYMFSKAQTLKAIVLPKGLRRVDGKAFFGARQLEEVRAADQLAEIGEMAFMNCVSLESVSLGASPLQIGRFAFGSCRRLKRISLRAETPPEVDPTAFSGLSAPDCQVLVTVGSLPAYREDSAWQAFNLVTKDKPVSAKPAAEKPVAEKPVAPAEPEVPVTPKTPEIADIRKKELAALVSSVEQHSIKKETRPDAWVETISVQDRYSIQNGGSVALLFSCVTKFLEGIPVRVEARLYHSDGSPLKDMNNDCCLSGGQVGVWTELNPKFVQSRFSQIVLTLPYTEFHLGGHPEKLEWRISFFAKGKQVGEEKSYPYSWTGPSCIRISSFHLESGLGSAGAYLDGLVSFKANNCAGKNGRCVLFLFHENGKPVQDRNGSYCTIDGQVCSSAVFSPKYASSQFSDFRMRLPLSEFHLDGVKTRLKLLVQIFVEDVPLATTDPVIIKWNL